MKNFGLVCFMISLCCILQFTTVLAAPNNLAKGAVVTVDSEETEKGNFAINAVDGNRGTRWAANDGDMGHWIKVDLGEVKNIAGSSIEWETPSRIYGYKIEASDDDSNWTTVVDKTKNNEAKMIIVDEYKTKARYLRITNTSATDWGWASIVEFNVFEDTGSENDVDPNYIDIMVILDGNPLMFPDQTPIIVENRTLVPLRALFEALGAEVMWDDPTQTVSAKKGDVEIKLPIGSHKVEINGAEVELDVPAQLVNDRTMVPLRFLSEAVGANVNWVDSSATVYVTSNNDDKWELVFEENFDGTEVDTNTWNIYDGPGHNKNGLRSPRAFSVKDGLLTVTAKMIGEDLVSGGMAHKKNYKYGKFEFRVKSDPDPSGATSAVVLTWPQSEKWPVDGENDMYETGQSKTRDRFTTYIHYDIKNYQKQFIHNVDAKEWHTVAMEWSEDEIKMYVDGNCHWVLRDKEAIPDVAHHICIQLDAFRTSMTGETKMYVDWVKIYQAK